MVQPEGGPLLGRPSRTEKGAAAPSGASAGAWGLVGGGGAVQTATGSGASVSCPKGSVRKRTGGVVPVGLSCVLVVSETPCPWDGERTELLG